MNGQKYGLNYAPRAHGFNLRSRLEPVSYYGRKRPIRLHEAMWDNLLARHRRFGCATPDEITSWDGKRVRQIKWGKTFGWWQLDRPSIEGE
jgi:hypothetical protein